MEQGRSGYTVSYKNTLLDTYFTCITYNCLHTSSLKLVKDIIVLNLEYYVHSSV